MSTFQFFRRFIRHPLRVGACTPSSRELARRAIAPVPRTGDPVVVELGPGSGAFTHAIQRRLGGRGRHLAIEIDGLLAGLLRDRYPLADVVEADAVALPEVMAALCLARVDVVISGLPWANFPPQRVSRTLDAVASCLAPHGTLTTVANLHSLSLPSARRLHRELITRFEEVVPSRTVWASVPPALVYYARRPA